VDAIRVCPRGESKKSVFALPVELVYKQCGCHLNTAEFVAYTG